MRKSLSLLEGLSQEVRELVNAAEIQAGLIDVLSRLGAQTAVQLALQEEVDRLLGSARDPGGNLPIRNGVRERRLISAAGPLRVGIPKLRKENGLYRPVVEAVRRGSDVVRRLVQGMYVRGESTRDVARTINAAYGSRLLQRDTVSRITREMRDQWDRFRSRDLKGLDVIYLILDALYAGIRKDTRDKEGLLAAYGYLADGSRVFLGLGIGSRESYSVCLEFLRDLKARGMREPILTTHDGSPGWIKAVPEAFEHSLQQRCQKHKMENILDKVPDSAREEIHRAVRNIFDESSLAKAQREAERVIRRYRSRYGSAMECLSKDVDALLAHMQCPKEHWRRVRTTNHLERLFEEGRRRLKVIPRMPDEQGTLTLFYSTILDYAQTWRGLRMSDRIERDLAKLREKLLGVKPALVTL